MPCKGGDASAARREGQVPGVYAAQCVLVVWRGVVVADSASSRAGEEGQYMV